MFFVIAGNYCMVCTHSQTQIHTKCVCVCVHVCVCGGGGGSGWYRYLKKIAWKSQKVLALVKGCYYEREFALRRNQALCRVKN